MPSVALSTQGLVSSCHSVFKRVRWSQSYDSCHCPQSSLLFASACCLLRSGDDSFFLILSVQIKSNYARFSLLTLDIGTVTYLEKVVSQLGEATAFHPCCVWPTYSFQELLKNKEVLLNNKLIFCHRVNYLLC